MSGRSISTRHTKKGMELDKLKEEPHMSGAYIRSLVKQLTSSRTKDPMSPKGQDCVAYGDSSPGKKIKKRSELLGESKQADRLTQPQQHKKQVRRRMHTSRPYQQRLLNMAEARREIVTALKHHRAAMKQASEQQRQSKDQQLPLSLDIQPSLQPYVEQDGIFKSRRKLRVYPSSTNDLSNHLDNYSFSSISQTPIPEANPFWWSAAPPLPENPNFILPNQTLGLNLNIHDFNNLDTTLYHNRNNTSLDSVSSPSTSSSSPPPPPPYIATYQEVPSISQVEGSPALADSSQGSAGLHAAVDDEVIAEIRSIGEQHQMEWNDTMSLVTSARWFKFLKSMELGTPVVKAEEDDSCHAFEVIEFPSWLNANDSCLEKCSDEYFNDLTLPCMDMDIGDIEGLDGDWWASQGKD